MINFSQNRDYNIEFETKWYVSSLDEWLLVPSIDIFIRGISVPKASEILGVGRALIYTWISRGKVKGWREGHKRWADVEDLLRFLDEHRTSYDFLAFQEHIFAVYRSIRREIIGNIGIKEVKFYGRIG